MGSLNLPQAGLVYLDTDAIIYSVEKIAPYSALLSPLWQAAQSAICNLQRGGNRRGRGGRRGRNR
jgi:hypothetical protein